jgi:predicted MFS family arabinose efflux permease
VEAGLPLALLSYGGFVVVFLVLFLLVSGREIQLKKSSGGVVGFLCRRQCVFGRILSVFFFSGFEAKSTHIRRFLLDTRHLAAFPVAFHPYRQKYWSRASPELGAWSSRAKESLLSDCA